LIDSLEVEVLYMLLALALLFRADERRGCAYDGSMGRWSWSRGRGAGLQHRRAARNGTRWF
jgi:hypothetical protein